MTTAKASCCACTGLVQLPAPRWCLTAISTSGPRASDALIFPLCAPGTTYIAVKQVSLKEKYTLEICIYPKEGRMLEKEKK